MPATRVAAGDQRVDRRRGGRASAPRRPSPTRDDAARELVAHDQRRRAVGLVAEVALELGAADPDRLGREQHLAAPRARGRGRRRPTSPAGRARRGRASDRTLAARRPCHAPVIVPPGEGTRYGNVEFLARTADTPRFTFGIIEFQADRTLEPHVHADEDDAFYILEGELTFVVGDDARGGRRRPGHVRARAARRAPRLHQPRRHAGADAQPSCASGLRPPDRRRLRRRARPGGSRPSVESHEPARISSRPGDGARRRGARRGSARRGRPRRPG